MSIQLHPRTRIVDSARADISDAVMKAFRTHELTFTELLYLLAQEAHSWASTAIKAEREDLP